MKVTVLAASALILVTGFMGAEAQAGSRHLGAGGYASWYGFECGGSRTASGERLNPAALTAAHRFWPFGTRVRVTNNQNGRSVVVRINDRGPFSAGRVIDLTKASARAIGMRGIARVTLARL